MPIATPTLAPLPRLLASGRQLVNQRAKKTRCAFRDAFAVGLAELPVNVVRGFVPDRPRRSEHADPFFHFTSDTLSCECKLTCLKFGTIFRLLLCPLNPMQKEFRSHYSISEQFLFAMTNCLIVALIVGARFLAHRYVSSKARKIKA